MATATSAPVPAGQGTTTSWIWWLLGFLVLAGGAAAALLVRSRRAQRKRWLAAVGAAERESVWLSRDVVEMINGESSAQSRRNLWHVARPRVQGLEGTLAGLAPAGPTEDRLETAVGALAAAVRRVRITVDHTLGEATGQEAAETAMLAAHVELDEAIAAARAAAPVPPPPPDQSRAPSPGRGNEPT